MQRIETGKVIPLRSIMPGAEFGKVEVEIIYCVP